MQSEQKYIFDQIPNELVGSLNYDVGVIIRIDTKLYTKNMKDEFMFILEKVTGKIFNPDEYDGINNIEQAEEGVKAYCICTKQIYNIHKITHIETQTTFQVGSECINKVDCRVGGLYDKITKDRCKICSSLLLNKISQPMRSGYCSNICVKQGDSNLYSKLTKKQCIICSKYLIDMRKQPMKYGFCSIICRDEDDIKNKPTELCIWCNTNFNRTLDNLQNIFCSDSNCKYLFNINRKKSCKTCTNSIDLKQVDISYYNRGFCSKNCKDEFLVYPELKNYIEVSILDIEVDNQFYYTYWDHNKDKRKIVDSICIKKNWQELVCNNYKFKTFKDWSIDITNKFKKYRLYKANYCKVCKIPNIKLINLTESNMFLCIGCIDFYDPTLETC
jgi:hypothetical protein